MRGGSRSDSPRRSDALVSGTIAAFPPRASNLWWAVTFIHSQVADRMKRLRWIKIGDQIMTTATSIGDGELLRLFVAAEPHGRWDWRVWHTLRGHEHRFGLADTAAEAVEAAEDAAVELSDEGTRAATSLRSSGPEPMLRNAIGGDPSLRSPLYSWRVSDKILGAFHFACDDADIEVAKALLRVLDMMTMYRRMPEDGRQRRIMEQLVAAHTRRWLLSNQTDG